MRIGFVSTMHILTSNLTHSHRNHLIHNSSTQTRKGPGWLNELGRWTYQLIQAHHQYGMGSRPAL